MSKLKPWLYLALIFVAGAVTGSALTIGLASRFMPAPGAQQMKARWMGHLTKQLNLTDDQQKKIEPIVADSENQIQAVRREDIDRVSQIIKKANAQIATILTPDQQAQMQKMSQEMDRNRDKMFPGHMRPWGGPPPHGGPPPPPPDH